MAYAYVEGSVVRDRTDNNPEAIFHPQYAAQFMDAPDDVQIGWSYTDGVFSPPASLAPDISLLESEAARAQRDALLAETDWVIAKAVEQHAVDGLGIQVPMVWATYRQALRDVPQQAGFPANIQWPTKPE